VVCDSTATGDDDNDDDDGCGCGGGGDDDDDDDDALTPPLPPPPPRLTPSLSGIRKGGPEMRCGMRSWVRKKSANDIRPVRKPGSGPGPNPNSCPNSDPNPDSDSDSDPEAREAGSVSRVDIGRRCLIIPELLSSPPVDRRRRRSVRKPSSRRPTGLVETGPVR